MRENTNQKNSEYGHFSHSVKVFICELNTGKYGNILNTLEFGSKQIRMLCNMDKVPYIYLFNISEYIVPYSEHVV